MNPTHTNDFGLGWPVEVDLHLHTTASDGLLSPEELVQFIAQIPLQVIAIADHDSTEGVDEAIAAVESFPGVSIIPAVEIGTEKDDVEVHLLGYFIDHKNEELQAGLRWLRDARTEAARRTVEKLADLGVHVSWGRVLELATGVVGRPHIARAMVEEGYIEEIHEAFEYYLGDNGKARVEREKLAPLDGLRLVHAAGGVGVVAHPRTVNHLEKTVEQLVSAGLAGIEVYAEHYDAAQRRTYGLLADRFGLVHCGGTDYHAFGTEGEVIPGEMGPPRDSPSLLFEKARALHGEKVGSSATGSL